MLFLKKLFTKDGIDGREVSHHNPRYFDEARNNVIPWIKVTYPFTRENCQDTVEQLFEGENMPVFQFWQDDLCIFYAVEKEGRTEFLLQRDLPKTMFPNDLHEIAVRNLDRDISYELGRANFGGYALIASQGHESSALCLPYVWEWICSDLKDNLLVGVPSRNQVLIVPERDANNLANMKIHIHECFKKGSQLLTRNIFRVDKRTFEWTVAEQVGKDPLRAL